MNWRIILAVGIAAFVALPSAAFASHMGQYILYPVAHDAEGTVYEPDGASTSVLGPTVTNCVVDLPLGGGFSHKCGDDALKTGLGELIAPGCTGDDGAGGPIARESGQCGIWTVGLRPNSVAVIPPGTVPAPISEQGMGAGKFPGRYSGTVAFLDGAIDSDLTQNPGTGGPTNMVGLNRILREQGVGNWVIPGDSMLWAWMGQWTDLNGNGVVDACFATCTAGAEVNEFVWWGNCLAFGPAPNAVFAVTNGYCAQDPNPNIQGSRECDIAAGEEGPCANAGMSFWIFPGNHNPGMATDTPGEQIVDFALRLGDCSTPPTCDDDSTGCEDVCSGDSFLDIQDYVTPDGLGMDDRSGDNGAANVGDDTARHWAGDLGNVQTHYGDDGFLETEIIVYGYNCAVGTPNALDLGTAAGTDGGCTFLDVDIYPTANSDAEAALVGTGDDYPNGGLKGQLRATWLLVRDGLGVPNTLPISNLEESVVNGQDVYLATQGPAQGGADDIAIDPGFSREPNQGTRSYVDAAGVSHSVTESFLGTVHGDCSGLPPGDPRAGSDEAEHRGFCNTGPGGLGSAYSAWTGSVGRGWVDAQPLRHAFVGAPITVSPPCLYCFFGFPFVGIGASAEQPEGFAGANAGEHTRTLGPGQYLFQANRGTWQDGTYTNDESLFPDPVGTTIASYGPDNWVNGVARTTGQWHYRNFLPVTCTTEKDAAGASSVHEAAECNPYLDGNVDNPQDYAIGIAAGGEFDGTLQFACAGSQFNLAPADGVLDTQIVVVRNYAQGIGPLLPNVGGGIPVIETYGPGAVDPLISGVTCTLGAFLTSDELVWAQGNFGDDIVTFVTHEVPLSVDLNGDGNPDSDSITDVDFYAGWGL
jgi:hypothetical protein